MKRISIEERERIGSMVEEARADLTRRSNGARISISRQNYGLRRSLIPQIVKAAVKAGLFADVGFADYMCFTLASK